MIQALGIAFLALLVAAAFVGVARVFAEEFNWCVGVGVAVGWVALSAAVILASMAAAGEF